MRSTATDAVDQVAACFRAYEAALMSGDTAGTDRWFAEDERVVRFGTGDEQWGVAALRRWRRGAPPVPADRTLQDTRVDLWSHDVAVVTTRFRYPAAGALGRQSQTWLRTAAGWRIIHAHVSYPEPA